MLLAGAWGRTAGGVARQWSRGACAGGVRCLSRLPPPAAVEPHELAVLPEARDYAELRQKFDWAPVLPEYFNIAWSCCDRHALAPASRARPAIVHHLHSGKSRTVTFGELKESSDRLANALVHGLGLSKGDRVGILMPQRPETALAHMATYKAACIAVPLFTLFGLDALQFRLQNSGCKVLFVEPESLDKIQEIRTSLPDLEAIVVVESEETGVAQHLPDGMHHLHRLLEEASALDVSQATLAEDPAMIIFTSGTTGSPKGALHAHRVLLGHLPGIEFPHNFFPKSTRPYGSLCFYTPADWAWIGGLIDVLLPSLHYGVPVLAHRAKKYDPEFVLWLMRKYGVTNTFMPPTALKLMKQQGVKEKAGFLHSVACGGESLGTKLLEWGEEQFGLTINEFYGQTEANLLVGNSAKLTPVKQGSMGVAIPGRTIAVVNEKGEEVPRGTVGVIAAKRPDPIMFLGYWQNETATKEKFIGDWLITGDLGKQTEDGYFYFFGREDDVINSAGYRIGPSEVENCIMKYPGVTLCAVIGAPDELRNEIVKAFCVLREGVKGDEKFKNGLQNFVKTQLAAYEYPREIEIVKELPMTTTGKIQRNVLKAQELERHAKRSGAAT